MTENKKEQPCPRCHGKGTITGTCVCDSEWRGSQSGEAWEDCRCERELPCPVCQGTGQIKIG